MTDVIYFIEPSRPSVAKLLADFPENDQLEYD